MPYKQKGGAGTVNPEHRLNDQKLAGNDNRQSSRKGRARHEGQQHLLRGAYIHQPKPGHVQAPIVPWDQCPVCGYQGRHNGTWPPPKTMWKTCTLCGHRDELTLFPVPASVRVKRDQAVAS